jgi:Rhodopirellula transposase DDE domain
VEVSRAQRLPAGPAAADHRDAGGSNGYRTRARKTGLAALATETGLEITCCHFPPGTPKWNKVEHRLFPHITMNWRGRPLTSHEVIVQTIAATTTRTGLRVRAELDTSTYDTGVKVSDRQMDALPLTRHDWHGDWNYTLRSEAYDQEQPVQDLEPDVLRQLLPALAKTGPTPSRREHVNPSTSGLRLGTGARGTEQDPATIRGRILGGFRPWTCRPSTLCALT